MRLISFAVTILLLAGGNAFAFNEPDGFRGVPWGATEDALRDKLGEANAHGILWDKCDAYPPAQRWLADRYCAGAFRLGDMKLDARYMFRDDRFVGVTLTFPSADFDYLAAIFSERYGAPTSSTLAPPDHQINHWHGEHITITIQRYDPGAYRRGAAWLGLRTDPRSVRRQKEQTEESERLRQQPQIKDAAKEL